jgi:hypothetical protein
MNVDEFPVQDKLNDILFERMLQMAERLKAYCEKMEGSSFS